MKAMKTETMELTPFQIVILNRVSRGGNPLAHGENTTNQESALQSLNEAGLLTGKYIARLSPKGKRILAKHR